MNNDKKKKESILIILAIVALACLVLFAGNYPLIDLIPSEISEEQIPMPADVELYKFNSLATNASANIELWIINIGDETATNISVFVRTRSQNGTILFSGNIPLTVLVLRANETCSGVYAVPFNTTLIHTIEISWNDGRNSYQKT